MPEPTQPLGGDFSSTDSDLPTDGPSARAVRCFLLGIATDCGPRLLAFQTGNVLIGRLPDNHLAINHTSVSRRHARISIGPKGAVIEDMGSQNGTTVNGTTLRGSTAIRPGDILRLGHVPVYYFGFFDPEHPPQPEWVDHAVAINPSVGALG